MNKNKQNNKVDAEKKEAWWRRSIKVFGLEAPILMIMGVLVGILLSIIFVLSIPDLFIQPLIANTVRATIAAQPTTNTQVTIATVIVTEVVQVTPTPNEGVFQINSVPLRIFPYAGGNDSQVQGHGVMSISYDEDREINYTLDYSLPAPEQGFTWAGIAMQFSQPANLAQYKYIEVAIKFSDVDARCEIKFVDKADNRAYFRLGDAPRSNTDVVVTVDGDRQVIQIPLRGNFDSVNLEQVKEIAFAVSSNLGSGNHYFILSRIKFLK